MFRMALFSNPDLAVYYLKKGFSFGRCLFFSELHIVGIVSVTSRGIR